MPVVSNVQNVFAELQNLANTYEVEPQPQRYFTEPEKVAEARRLGEIFWFPKRRAYNIFLHAYAALFSIPALTWEGVRRQHDRFVRSELPFTVTFTAKFILDAFGYDAVREAPQDRLYWPAPVIRGRHGRQVDGNARVVKERISDVAMIYFGTHLIRAAELLCDHPIRNALHDFDVACAQHFDYMGSFFRTANYHFPRDRSDAEEFCRRVDEALAGNEFAEYWENVLHAAQYHGIDLSQAQLRDFLLPHSRRLFAQHFGLSS
ncbi:MAG: hypothetical protein NZT92_01080 [Abditibacteriales bacterium]|nr:hypothetical protein [Abditibacteriales bacterium]MDW8364412.1 hypothetical protein [Abditibacteriales bacterium]